MGAAIPQLEKALQLDPSLQQAHYHLGLSYFQEQRYPEALRELQRAAQFDPYNAAVHFCRILRMGLLGLKGRHHFFPKPFELLNHHLLGCAHA